MTPLLAGVGGPVGGQCPDVTVILTLGFGAPTFPFPRGYHILPAGVSPPFLLLG